MSQAIFLRVLEPDTEEKGAYLTARIQTARVAGVEPDDVFFRNPQRFAAIPKSPFAYWVSERIRQIFEEFPPLEGSAATVKQGLATADDFRFVRTWWEVDPERIGYSAEHSEQGKGWIHFAKGGSYSPYYADVHLVVNWIGRGAEIKNYVAQRYPYLKGNWAWVVKHEDCYFQPGLTWPLRSQAGLSVRSMPAGCVFGHKGPAVLPSEDSAIAALLAVANSNSFRALVEAQMAFGSYEVGVLQRTPVPADGAMTTLAAELPESLFELRRSPSKADETTHNFLRPSLARIREPLASLWTTLEDAERQRLDDEATLGAQIDAEVARMYGLRTEAFNAALPSAAATSQDGNDAETEPAALPRPDTQAAELLSWCWGVVVGRWDIRIAGSGEFDCDLPDFTARLPELAPGALVTAKARPATAPAIASEAWLRARRNSLHIPTPDEVDGPVSITTAAYPIDVAWDGVLVDDPGHPKDIIRKVREVLRHLYSDRAQEIEEETVEILQGDGRTPRTLRDWFRNQKATDLGASFFDFHIKRYSKSRRKAPIYWRLCTSPGRGQSSYGIWLYYHRLTDDTLWKVLREYVTPRRELEERRLEETRRKLSAAEGSDARKLEGEIEERAEFLEEIGWFEEEIRRVAQSGWAPNRDDGVIINLAPLHRLVSWNEPEKVWKKLEAGEYDWAHLAMRHWPERVKRRCRSDKSLAMAHDRLDLYEGEQ